MAEHAVTRLKVLTNPDASAASPVSAEYPSPGVDHAARYDRAKSRSKARPSTWWGTSNSATRVGWCRLGKPTGPAGHCPSADALPGSWAQTSNSSFSRDQIGRITPSAFAGLAEGSCWKRSGASASRKISSKSSGLKALARRWQ
jgi:hypothetical protein